MAQKIRRLWDEKSKVVDVKVKKLQEACFIWEVTYTTWLVNVVIVKKSNDQWRMCTNFIDPNKACPKDAHPLLSIDELVDDASGHQILRFLDVYSSYT